MITGILSCLFLLQMVYYSAVPFSHWYSRLFDTLTQKSNSGLLYFVFLYSVFFQVYYFFKWHIIQQPRKTLRLASASQFLKSLCLGNPPSLARFANLFYILFFHVYYFFKWFIIQQPRFIFYLFFKSSQNYLFLLSICI